MRARKAITAVKNLIKGLCTANIDPVATGCDEDHGITIFYVYFLLVMIFPAESAVSCDRAFSKNGLDDAKDRTGSQHPYWIVGADRKHNNRDSNLARNSVVAQEAE